MLGACLSWPILSLEFPVWQMVLRGTVIFWFLFLVFRFLLRRDIGSLGVADLLFVVLVADAASNAMQGQYKTISDGLVLLMTLIGWNFLIDWLGFRYEAVSRFLEPPAEIVIKHGRVNHRGAQAGDGDARRAESQAARAGRGGHRGRQARDRNGQPAERLHL